MFRRKQSPAEARIEDALLRSREPLSRPMIRGWPGLLFGLLSLTAGLPVTAIALGWIEYPVSDARARMVACLFGISFSIAGICFFAEGVLDLARRARLRSLGRAHPDEPWLADHSWTAHRLPAWTVPLTRRILAASIWITLLVTCIAWLGREEVERATVLGLSATLLVLLCMLGYAVYRLAAWAKYGPCWIELDSFPLHPGETLSAHLHAERYLSKAGELALSLRLVEVSRESHRSGREVQVRQVARGRLRLDQRIPPAGADGSGIPFTFELPEDAPGTRLSETPAIYWELEVVGAGTRPRLRRRFLVPIYSEVDPPQPALHSSDGLQR